MATETTETLHKEPHREDKGQQVQVGLGVLKKGDKNMSTPPAQILQLTAEMGLSLTPSATATVGLVTLLSTPILVTYNPFDSFYSFSNYFLFPC